MLNIRVTGPTDLVDEAAAEVRRIATVADVAVVRGDGEPAADLLLFDVAREDINTVMSALRAIDTSARGAIVVSEPLVVLSDEASAAESHAPGHPADGVVWAQLADRSREDARPSWSFFAFLLLATLIAGIGRVLDQPILIIGAMVVGPEFAPIAAICYAIVRRKPDVARIALATLFGGFAACALIAWGVWSIVYALGLITFEQATTGPLTHFIVSPDAWSFVIALLAGVAGVLSLTSEKSSALVGVFISITTVPAVGTLGVVLAVGAWNEARAALVQLLLNLAGILIAGTLTLAVQLLAGRRLSTALRRRRAARAAQRPTTSR